MTRAFVCLAAALSLLTLSGCGEVQGGGVAVAPNSAALKPIAPAPADKDLKITAPPLAPSPLPSNGAQAGQSADAQPTDAATTAAAPASGQPASVTQAGTVSASTPAAKSGSWSFKNPFSNIPAAKTATPSGPGSNSPADGSAQILISSAEFLRVNRKQVHVEVTYSFVQGKPTPTDWYTLVIRGQGGAGSEPPHADLKFEGSSLQARGTLKRDISIGGRDATFGVHFMEAASRDGEGRQVSTVFEAPVRRDSNRGANGATLKPAGVGVGAQGKGYGAGMITTPVSAYFSAKEMIVFKISLPNAMNFFKGQNNRNPKSQEEFDEKIIKDNAITLPELPAGERYVYDPQAGELMVEHPKK